MNFSGKLGKSIETIYVQGVPFAIMQRKKVTNLSNFFAEYGEHPEREKVLAVRWTRVLTKTVWH